MNPTEVSQAIRSLTHELIRHGLADRQNLPSIRRAGQETHISIAGSPDLSMSFNDVPYADIFDDVLKANAFNFQLIDGSLVQLLYCFNRRNLVSHRLFFLPDPGTEYFDVASEIFRDEPLFGDIFAVNSVRTPLRFDYSSSAVKLVDKDHPRSHLTIGMTPNCRIPTTSPLTPHRFMRFILRNFYFSAYSTLMLDEPANAEQFPDCISDNERAIFHCVG